MSLLYPPDPVRVKHELYVPYIVNKHHAVLHQGFRSSRRWEWARQRSLLYSQLEEDYGPIPSPAKSNRKYTFEELPPAAGLEFTTAGIRALSGLPADDKAHRSSFRVPNQTPKEFNHFSAPRRVSYYRHTRTQRPISSYRSRDRGTYIERAAPSVPTEFESAESKSQGRRNSAAELNRKAEALYEELRINTDFVDETPAYTCASADDKYGMDSYYNRYGSYNSFGDSYGARGLYGDHIVGRITPRSRASESIAGDIETVERRHFRDFDWDESTCYKREGYHYTNMDSTYVDDCFEDSFKQGEQGDINGPARDDVRYDPEAYSMNNGCNDLKGYSHPDIYRNIIRSDESTSPGYETKTAKVVYSHPEFDIYKKTTEERDESLFLVSRSRSREVSIDSAEPVHPGNAEHDKRSSITDDNVSSHLKIEAITDKGNTPQLSWDESDFAKHTKVDYNEQDDLPVLRKDGGDPDEAPPRVTTESGDYERSSASKSEDDQLRVSSKGEKAGVDVDVASVGTTSNSFIRITTPNNSISSQHSSEDAWKVGVSESNRSNDGDYVVSEAQSTVEHNVNPTSVDNTRADPVELSDINSTSGDREAEFEEREASADNQNVPASNQDVAASESQGNSSVYSSNNIISENETMYNRDAQTVVEGSDICGQTVEPNTESAESIDSSEEQRDFRGQDHEYGEELEPIKEEESVSTDMQEQNTESESYVNSIELEESVSCTDNTNDNSENEAYPNPFHGYAVEFDVDVQVDIPDDPTEYEHSSQIETNFSVESNTLNPGDETFEEVPDVFDSQKNENPSEPLDRCDNTEPGIVECSTAALKNESGFADEQNTSASKRVASNSSSEADEKHNLDTAEPTTVSDSQDVCEPSNGNVRDNCSSTQEPQLDMEIKEQEYSSDISPGAHVDEVENHEGKDNVLLPPKEEVAEKVAHVILHQSLLKDQLDEEKDIIKEIIKYKNMKWSATKQLAKEVSGYKKSISETHAKISQLKGEMNKIKLLETSKHGAQLIDVGDMVEKHSVIASDLEVDIIKLEKQVEVMTHTLERKKEKMMSRDAEIQQLRDALDACRVKSEQLKKEATKAGGTEFDDFVDESEVQKAKEIIKNLDETFLDVQSMVEDVKTKNRQMLEKYKKYADDIEEMKNLTLGGGQCNCNEKMVEIKDKVKRLFKDVEQTKTRAQEAHRRAKHEEDVARAAEAARKTVERPASEEAQRKAFETSKQASKSSNGNTSLIPVKESAYEDLTIKKEVVVPASLHNDKTTVDMMNELGEMARFKQCPIVGEYVMANEKRHVLVPCVAASRLGSDIGSALNASNLRGNTRIVLTIFHPIAKHNSLSAPTSTKLQDEEILQRCTAIIDVLFWNGEIYDCQTNTDAVKQLRRLLRKK